MVLVSGVAFRSARCGHRADAHLHWYAIMLPPAGMAALTMMTAANATLQLAVTPAMRGRVMSLYLMVFAAVRPSAPDHRLDGRSLRPALGAAVRRRHHRRAALVATAALARRASLTVRAHLRPLPHLHVRAHDRRRAVRLFGP